MKLLKIVLFHVLLEFHVFNSISLIIQVCYLRVLILLRWKSFLWFYEDNLQMFLYLTALPFKNLLFVTMSGCTADICVILTYLFMLCISVLMTYSFYWGGQQSLYWCMVKPLISPYPLQTCSESDYVQLSLDIAITMASMFGCTDWIVRFKSFLSKVDVFFLSTNDKQDYIVLCIWLASLPQRSKLLLAEHCWPLWNKYLYYLFYQIWQGNCVSDFKVFCFVRHTFYLRQL